MTTVKRSSILLIFQTNHILDDGTMTYNLCHSLNRWKKKSRSEMKNIKNKLYKMYAFYFKCEYMNTISINYNS